MDDPRRRIERWARRLGRELTAVALALRHPDTPTTARIVAVAVLAYALSPVDLVPDFIPVLGYLDDLLLVPLGIALVARLVPDPVWSECRRRAAGAEPPRPGLLAGAVAALVVALWVALGFWAWGKLRA